MKRTLLFFTILILLILAVFIGNVSAKRCDCGECTSGDYIGCVYFSDPALGGHSSCLISRNIGGWEGGTCTGIERKDECADSNTMCKNDACPSADSDWDGVDCYLRMLHILSCFDRGSGKFDASEDKCVECSAIGGKGEGNIYGDSSSIKIDWEGNNPDPGDGECESACGADSACDEKNLGDPCEAGKPCDSLGTLCVAGQLCTGGCICETTTTTSTTTTITSTTLTTIPVTIPPTIPTPATIPTDPFGRMLYYVSLLICVILYIIPSLALMIFLLGALMQITESPGRRAEGKELMMIAVRGLIITVIFVGIAAIVAPGLKAGIETCLPWVP